MEKNEVRFLVAIYGDTEDFAQNYESYIMDVAEYNSSNKSKKIVKPKKADAQKIADKDGFVPEHPFSAINCYTFKFSDLFDLKEYFFVIKSKDGQEFKYKINNSEIF